MTGFQHCDMIYNGTHHFKPDQCWSGVAQSRIYIWQVISSTLLNHQRRLDAFNNPLLQKVHWGLLVDSSFFSLSSFLICCCCLRCIVILWSPWVNIWSLYFCHFVHVSLDFLVIEMCLLLSAGQIKQNFPLFHLVLYCKLRPFVSKIIEIFEYSRQKYFFAPRKIV